MSPMLLTLGKQIFNSSEFLYEIKWDGYRLLTHINKTVDLISRNGNSFNKKFPSLVKSFEGMKGKYIFDGEVIAVDESGNPNFNLIKSCPNSGKPLYMAFDILMVKGKDVRSKPLIERKEILKKSLPKKENIIYVDYVEEKGKELFELIKGKFLEGVIAKRKTSQYKEGRSTNWIKFKNSAYCEAVKMSERFQEK